MEINRQKAGFTLIELMTVLLIMMILFGIAAAAFVTMNKGQGMASATRRAKGGMTVARQTAITKRSNSRIWFLNVVDPDDNRITNSCYVVCKDTNVISETNIIGETNQLPAGIICRTPTNIIFKTDGTCLADATAKLILQLEGEGQTNSLRVYPLTGIVRISASAEE